MKICELRLQLEDEIDRLEDEERALAARPDIGETMERHKHEDEALAKRMREDDLAVEMSYLQALDLLQDGDETMEQLHEAVVRLIEGAEPYEPHPLEPLTLDEVQCLPEMGGRMSRSPQLRRKGRHVNDQMFRDAIRDGMLTPLPLSARKHLLTRKRIQEFLECPAQSSRPEIASDQPRKAAARAKPNAKSSTEPGPSALDAALRMAAELKKR